MVRPQSSFFSPSATLKALQRLLRSTPTHTLYSARNGDFLICRGDDRELFASAWIYKRVARDRQQARSKWEERPFISTILVKAGRRIAWTRSRCFCSSAVQARMTYPQKEPAASGKISITGPRSEQCSRNFGFCSHRPFEQMQPSQGMGCHGATVSERPHPSQRMILSGVLASIGRDSFSARKKASPSASAVFEKSLYLWGSAGSAAACCRFCTRRPCRHTKAYIFAPASRSW